MKRIVVLLRPTVAHELDYLNRFARGIQAHGDRADVGRRSRVPPSGSVDAIAVWGWRQAMVYRKLGFNVLVCERGYVGDRFRWTSIGLNGLNGRATFPQVADGGARWEKNFGELLQPWTYRPDGYALIMGQVPTDTAVRDIVFASWLRDAYKAAQRRYARVKFRPHPQAPTFRFEGTQTLGSLADDLSGAAQVITFNSNSGVDSVLAGIPAVAMDEGSMAYPVASHSIDEEPVRPDRTQWAHALAWAQWLPTELETGEAWSRLRTLF